MSCKGCFIHNFDEKMHYSIYYSLLELKDSDGIFVDDSVQNKKCHRGLGRWNFIVENQDYSCSVYNALEIIYQSITSAMKSNKSYGEIALAPIKSDSDVCYVFNYEDIERLKKAEVLTMNQNCKCDKKISKHIFFKIIKPVLEEMFKKKNLHLTTRIVNEYFGLIKHDLNVIRIEWNIDKVFKNMVTEQKAKEVKLQLTR